MGLFRDFDPIDIERTEEYLRQEEIEWTDHLEAKELRKQEKTTEATPPAVCKAKDSSFQLMWI